MKKIITGASLLLTGAILFLSVFVAASNLGLTGGGWFGPLGVFWQAVFDNGLLLVLIISIVFMLTGIVFLARGNTNCLGQTSSTRENED